MVRRKDEPCLPGKAHRWKLGEQNGTPNVDGTCAHCGAVKAFSVGFDAVRTSPGRMGYTKKQLAAQRKEAEEALLAKA